MDERVIQLPLNVPLLPVRVLKAGNIVCTYEKGNLRYIRYGDTELVRMIYVAVRDENWNTAAYDVEKEIVEHEENSFKVSYKARYFFEKVIYKTNVTIVGKSNGEISFSIDGEATKDFLSNRIGICVLHPLTCCGKRVDIVDPHNQVHEKVFPELISPQQPFINIAGMRWSPLNGLTANLLFEGDIFENEDQRNWTDGSFKTYSTPLSIPFPVSVKIGDSKQQRVVFSVQSDQGYEPEKIKNNPVEIKFPFPDINQCYLSLDVTGNNWQEQWQSAVSEAKDLNAKIVCVANISAIDDIPTVIKVLSTDSDSLYSILFVPENDHIANEKWLQVHGNNIKSNLPGVMIEFGSTGYFAELNRARLNSQHFDLVSFPVTPQAHLTDYRTVVDNLDSQLYLLKTIESFAPNKKVRVGPILFNSASENLRNTHFAAWWVLACIGNFAGADVITIGSVDKNSPLFKLLEELKKFKPIWLIQNQKSGFDSELIVENDKSERLAFRLEYTG